MKTLVLLSALAATTIAAPALSENRYVGYSPVSYQITPTFRREKKSATETNNNVVHLSEAQQFPRREVNHVPEVSKRAVLKKPIIVKNKLGYHLYRDSDEEQAQADSQEKCSKEVKVKLCDADNLEARTADLKKNSTCETDIHQSKSDMEQSIKIAKQAVEKLQHMKHDWKHSESGPDAELHKDIEVARQALEHIQQNFHNLETMNMQATTLSNTENLQDSHITNGERIAQWIEAINNIQRNAEIARTLKDDFTASNNQAHMMEQGKSNNELENIHNHEITLKNHFNNEPSNLNKLVGKEAKGEHEAIHQNRKAAVPEMKEAKFAHEKTLIPRAHMPVPAIERLSPDTSFTAKSELLDKNRHTEMQWEAKSSELNLNLKHPAAIPHNTPLESKERGAMKSAEVMKKEMHETKQSNNIEKTLESAIDTMQNPSMKSTELRNDFVHHADIKSQPKGLEIQKNSKSAWMESKDNDMLAKASEHIPIAVDHKKLKIKSDFTHENSMKSASHHENLEKEFTEKDEKHSHMKMKSSDIDVTKMFERHDHNVALKTADQVHNNEQASLMERISTSALNNDFDTDFTMKLAEHLNSKNNHHFNKASAFPTQAKNWQAHEMTSAKNAAVEQNVNDLHNTKRVVTFGLPVSHHNIMHHHYDQPDFHSDHHLFHHSPHDFHHSFHHDGLHMKAAEHEDQEKAAEMDNAVQRTFQQNMNRLSSKPDLEHNTHWKQDQMVAARGAYGSYGLAGAGDGAIGASASSLTGGSSGGSGAIGVFIQANTGRSAIPLLLGCSPSVVSGSLAKAQSGYEASAYRTGENLNLHTKRDTKKSYKLPATESKLAPTNEQ